MPFTPFVCRLQFLAVCILGIGLCPSRHARCEELPVNAEVEVVLTTERTMRGIVDERSDAQWLWLRSNSERVTLWTGLPMEVVASWQPVVLPRVAPSPPPKPVAETVVTPPAVSLAIVAEAANWDSDLEPDGILVRIQPIDSEGRIVPVAGMIDLELFGERRPWRGGEHVRRQPRHLELERWTRRLTQRDFGPAGATVRLEFRTFHPERELNVDTHALLKARLGIAGQAPLEASDPYVVLRPWSYFRDQVQQASGVRYLPQEGVRGRD
jgi:hypothetical protein